MTTARAGRHLRTCPLCEAMCGLEIHVEGGEVTNIRGNRDDVWSHGHLCPKGVSLAALHDDPVRIRRPLIKADGRWQEVSWDAAFRRCTELMTPVIDKYGIGAVTAYTGNPLAHSFSLARYAGVLLGMSGMPINYSPGTVDQWPKNLSSHLMYGGWWTFPVPDIERADMLVIMGANPAASQGSLLAAPDVMSLIEAIRKRGKVIVIDPVRTRTAARADEWLPIVPGTDAALLLAVAHTLFDEDLVRPGPHVDGVETMRRVAADWSPERVSAVTGIDEDRIRRLARELAGTDRSVVYGRIGLCNQEFGSLASWLVDVINILTRRRHGEVGGRRDQGARRGHRRDQTGRGVDAARLGARQTGHPHVGGQPLTRRQHQCAVAADVHRRAVRQRRPQRHSGDDHRRARSISTRAGQPGPGGRGRIHGLTWPSAGTAGAVSFWSPLSALCLRPHTR